MQKILLPTDFSEYSPELFKYAFELAHKFDSTLVAMHVYGDGEVKASAQKKQEEMADQMSDVLHDFISKNKSSKYKNVKIEYIVDVGLPGKEIVDVALDEDIELIVMGMTRTNNLTGAVFGSTALEVIGKADCPVLAIPASYVYKKPKRIVYMTDFVFRDIGVLQVLKRWSEVINTKTQCLHIVGKKEDEIDAAINMSMLKEVFQSVSLSKFEIRKGNLIKQTNQYLKENDIDIVATLSRKRDIIQRLLESSKTKKVAKKMERPLLVFKANAYKPISFPFDFSKFSIA